MNTMLEIVKERIKELEIEKATVMATERYSEEHKDRILTRLNKAIDFNYDLVRATGEWEADIVDLEIERKNRRK